ncbi:MAG: DUF2333 family protein [Thermodesulfobacteriota bacterium]
MGANNSTPGAGGGFGSFAAKQMLPIVLVAVGVIAALWIGIQYFEAQDKDQHVAPQSVEAQNVDKHAAIPSEAARATEDTHVNKDDHATAVEPAHEPQAVSAEDEYIEAVETGNPVAEILHETEEAHMEDHTAVDEKPHTSAENTGTAHEEPSTATNGHGTVQAKTYSVEGLAFVDALIQPMDYELNHRFYGWRPNDIIEYTNNVNNFQLGVLEVTRRTTRILAERIARTGTTARFDPNLENAMNWFMIKADRYWFPSAESKYKDGLKELRAYYDKLEKGEAEFYTRADNLIPLLAAYGDLLGSCDENLVKTHEVDGSPVGFFKADDYFFYAKGVISSMHTILMAVEHDFYNVMATREGSLEVLHHAIELCHHALQIEPWLILNSDYGSIWANHRANMAAPISHAKFYIAVLIKTLST